MASLNFWENLIEEEDLADKLEQQGYSYLEVLGMIKRHGVDKVSTMFGGVLDHDMVQKFHQQIVLEQWSVVRGITNVSIPDFTDYLCNRYGFLSNSDEIDSAYAEWSKQC